MNDPSVFKLSVPLEGFVILMAVSEVLSTSVSFERTPGAATTAGVSSFVLAVSLAAMGASLTALIVIWTVAVLLVFVPSEAR